MSTNIHSFHFELDGNRKRKEIERKKMIREKLIKIIGDVTPLAFFYGFKPLKTIAQVSSPLVGMHQIHKFGYNRTLRSAKYSQIKTQNQSNFDP